MDTCVSARRDFQALQQRRRHAARLFAGGQLILAAIARRLNVSRQSVTRWYREWRRQGAAGLRGAGRAGRKPRLDRQQLRRLDGALRRGPRAYGFETDLWTLPRVARVIEQVTGVRYHPGHVWKLLGAMDWSLQRPARQARERNAEVVQYWVDHRWPAVKNTLAAATPGSASRTRAASRSARPSGAAGCPAGKRPS